MALAALLVGCASSPPPPASSQYLSVKSGGFVLDDQSAMYTLGLDISQDLAGGIVARAHFENPAPGGDEFVVDVPIEQGSRQFTVESPPLPCIDNGSIYEVRVELLENEVIIDSVVQPLLFNMPAAFLEQRRVARCGAE